MADESTSGSDWQRQALTTARAGATATRQPDAASPAAKAARQRAAAQEVPDMFAAIDPQPAPQIPAAQAAPSDSAPGKPMIASTLAADTPTAAVVGSGGSSTGKKVAVTLIVLIVALGAAGAGYFFVLK